MVKVSNDNPLLNSENSELKTFFLGKNYLYYNNSIEVTSFVS